MLGARHTTQAFPKLCEACVQPQGVFPGQHISLLKRVGCLGSGVGNIRQSMSEFGIYKTVRGRYKTVEARCNIVKARSRVLAASRASSSPPSLFSCLEFRAAKIYEPYMHHVPRGATLHAALNIQTFALLRVFNKVHHCDPGS